MKWEFKSKNEFKEKNPTLILDYLLDLRGIPNKDSFLLPTPEHIHDPFKLDCVREASEFIISALEKKQRIMIYGDYDADGISAVSLLYIILKKLNADVEFYLPNRMEEGYGLNKDAISQIKKKGTNLIITVDCGINASSEIEYAKKLGMNIIVTDHHVPERKTPCEIVINPKLSKNYPYPDLSGVGVAFKLCEGIEKISNLSRNFLLWNLDLVALGTVSDVMPLNGENRVLTSLGLKIMNERRRPGINCILNLAGHKGEIKAHHIGFIIGPRINALGRLDEATCAVELLTTYNKRKAKMIALKLEDYNNERRNIQAEIYKNVVNIIESSDIKIREYGIVLSNPVWHEGVIGIVAAKITEEYLIPTILISEKGDICKGSGRSIPDIDIMKILEGCKDNLEDYGGHPMACGIKIKKENIKEFSHLFKNLINSKFKKVNFEYKLSVDFPLSIEKVNKELIKKINELAPYGVGNPEPIFATFNTEVVGEPSLAKNKHLKFTVRYGDKFIPVIAFSQGERANSIKRNSKLDIAYTPIMDNWSKKPILKIHDFRVHK